MSSLSTKASKRRSSASRKIRATKGKKAASRKPQRPVRITAAPRAKKAAITKKLSAAKKGKPTRPLKKLASRPVKKTPTKSSGKASPTKRKKLTAPKASARKVVAKKTVARKPVRPPSRKLRFTRKAVAAPKPLPPPPKKPPSPGTLAAVRAFEQALRQFNRHDFAGARQGFEAILRKFVEHAEVVARVRTYLAICGHRLARTPSVPRNPDALYDQGVFEFNKGNTFEAIEAFGRALRVDSRADHVYYSLAAAYARLNDAPKALDALRRAIGLRPAHRSHARRDLDLASLRTNESFQQLTGFGFELVEE